MECDEEKIIELPELKDLLNRLNSQIAKIKQAAKELGTSPILDEVRSLNSQLIYEYVGIINEAKA